MNKIIMYNKLNDTIIINFGFKIYQSNILSTSEFLRNLKFESFVFIILFSLLFLTGIFTNLRVILLYTLNKNLKKCKNYYFVNLSVSSLIILLQCVPISITDLLTNGEWMFGVVYCNSFINFY